VRAELLRPDDSPFIGTVKAEVMGVAYDLLAAEETLTCCIIEVERPALYIGSVGYGERIYGDLAYAQTREVAI
jgi:hypothetical protein